ncbi:hypothetical protein DPMN_003222 [Dreissena polymorpha]|uniref:Uncharacterized protein n=1 Tax=Dreissena polymorpha TaxID=45954 RepID=A0A9D4ML55_DREPO|nr:hypothetical protein DPMN_003222 [Dreissena polymorpha]
MAPWRNFFSTDWNHFELVQDIIGTNLLTKFHEDATINVASTVLTTKNVTSRKTHVLTKFHEDWTKNVTSRVFTCFHYIHNFIEKTAPPPGGHVFSPIWTIFKLVCDINETNVLTKFHDDWAKIVTSRVFIRFLYSHIGNTAPPHAAMFFNGPEPFFELNQHTI